MKGYKSSYVKTPKQSRSKQSKGITEKLKRVCVKYLFVFLCTLPIFCSVSHSFHCSAFCVFVCALVYMSVWECICVCVRGCYAVCLPLCLLNFHQLHQMNPIISIKYTYDITVMLYHLRSYFR